MAAEPNDYAAKAAEAEAAVKSVKDPELRRVAFEKILEHLLEGDAGRPGAAEKKKKKTSTLSTTKKKSSKGQTSSSKKTGPKGRVEELVEEGYFKKQRTIADVKAELANRGYHIPLTSLSGPLQTLTRAKKLRRQKAPAKGKGTKPTYAYSNW